VKIFCHIPRENWVVDRMGKEFLNYSHHSVSSHQIEQDTDIIWLLASWCWDQIPIHVLESKKVVCTIHHEVPEKFDKNRKLNFLSRDKFVDHYLTYTEETKKLINSLTNKPVDIIPHWLNDKIWIRKDKKEARRRLNLPDKFLVGSFQRDTEGSDLKTPKLEKGPDIFIDKVKQLSCVESNLHVVLSGWRRQYVIEELSKTNIPFSYIELPDQKTINDLYNSLDLYLISSRCEGGPQAVFEAAHLKVPVLSTPAGQYHLLSKNCIYDFNESINRKSIQQAITSVDENFKNISPYCIENFIKKYDDFFKGLV